MMQHAMHHSGGTRRLARARRTAMAALPVAALTLLAACGTEEEPSVEGPTASDTAEVEPTTVAPTPDEPTEEPTETDEPTETEATSEEPSEEPTSEEPTSEEPSEDPTDEPSEGAGDAMTVAENYLVFVASDNIEEAYALLSPESMAYYPDQETFEQHGIAGLAEDLDNSTEEPQISIRPAYEETHDSAQVVTVWGATEDDKPWAQSFAIRKLDGASWVIDQEITPSTGANRLNWLNPGIQEGVEEWMINPDQPLSFALLKKGGPNTAVTASINDGDGSQELTELPTDGAVIYELTGAELNDGFSAITASWVAEDAPFVHTSSTPAGYPR